MVHHILVVGDWRNDSRTPTAAEYDNMVNAINGSGAKYIIGVGDYKPVRTGYEIDKILDKITIPTYFIPGNHDSSGCNGGFTRSVHGKYYANIEGTGIQAEFAGSCTQKDFTKIVTGSPAIVTRHVPWFECASCKDVVAINLPANTVLALSGDSHCPEVRTDSAKTCIWINESSPIGQPNTRGCGELYKMSYVEFDDSISGKLTVRAKRVSAQSSVTRPSSWDAEVTVNWSGTGDGLCTGITCVDKCFGMDLYSQICDPGSGNCIKGILKQANATQCSGGTTGCVDCDSTENYCLMNVCIPKKYVLYGGIGLGAIILFKLISRSAYSAYPPRY